MTGPWFYDIFSISGKKYIQFNPLDKNNFLKIGPNLKVFEKSEELFYKDDL